MRVSIIGFDPELLFCAIRRVVDVYQIGSPLEVFLTTFKVCQHLERDLIRGELGHYVGEQRGPLARSLDDIGGRRNRVWPPRVHSFHHLPNLATLLPPHDGRDVSGLGRGWGRLADFYLGTARPGTSGNHWCAPPLGHSTRNDIHARELLRDRRISPLAFVHWDNEDF